MKEPRPLNWCVKCGCELFDKPNLTYEENRLYRVTCRRCGYFFEFRADSYDEAYSEYFETIEEIPSEICCNSCKYSEPRRHSWGGWELYCNRTGSTYQQQNVHPQECFCIKFRSYAHDPKSEVSFKQFIEQRIEANLRCKKARLEMEAQK